MRLSVTPAESTHPRVGGEDVTVSVQSRCNDDSPPRGRGRPRTQRRAGPVGRLTPAWAGKTRRPWPWGRGAPTHPRVGGEDRMTDRGAGWTYDSPPRGRGRPFEEPAGPKRGRLTPAWAGKTHVGASINGPRPTHPRVGGEDTELHGVESLRVDSPPRGRGRRRLRAGGRLRHRLTPAWAGKTSDSPAGRQAQSTHPRVGGEDLVPVWPNSRAVDSPPRGRGRRPTP